jgi:hypothetical protein
MGLEPLGPASPGCASTPSIRIPSHSMARVTAYRFRTPITARFAAPKSPSCTVLIDFFHSSYYNERHLEVNKFMN